MKAGSEDRGRWCVLNNAHPVPLDNLFTKNSYNAWGEHTVTNHTSVNIGNINRGYYYDTDVSRNCVPEKIKEIAADIRGVNSK